MDGISLERGDVALIEAGKQHKPDWPSHARHGRLDIASERAALDQLTRLADIETSDCGLERLDCGGV